MSDFVTRLQAVLGNAYQIERELPLGGLGRLFLATETSTGRQVSVHLYTNTVSSRRAWNPWAKPGGVMRIGGRLSIVVGAASRAPGTEWN